jgi:hypothetical protein
LQKSRTDAKMLSLTGAKSLDVPANFLSVAFVLD